jgi:soluble lytic murein transglycosylase-like protein
VASRTLETPRRPFTVALALTLLVAAVQWSPAQPMATPSLARLAASRLVVSPPMVPVSVTLPADSAALERDVVARFAHRPLAYLLRRHTRQPGMANRIARALVKEASRLQVEPSLLAGVLLTENSRLEPASVSSQGAIGLMQVMHFHAGEFDCGSADLLQVESNICHGARVFGRYLKRTGNVRTALLRYNGCVAGTNTPNCGRYPGKVLRTAKRIRYQLLRYSE